jgi:hypothetical protein
VASADHHGADDGLAKGGKLPAEGGHDVGVAEGEAHVGAVGLGCGLAEVCMYVAVCAGMG